MPYSPPNCLEVVAKTGKPAKIDAKKPIPATVKSALTGKAIPGLVADTGKSASALKREKQKLKKQQEEAKQKQQEILEQQQQQAEAQEPVDPAKRSKKINKILKQIDELKTKDPSALDEDQKAKIASEAGLREELKKLGI
ncbi:hypothetical protein MPSEU_001032100 [Mayamaea pseudoterrestris]|nr:hypothetical protein MPSEU_001032100 [Mayamaea pseudoterrestris]